MRVVRALMCLSALGAGAWFVSGAGGAAERQEGRGAIVHCAFFWFKDTATPGDIEAMIRGGREALAPLPCVKRCDIGPPLAQERGAPVDSSYHVGCVMEFADLAAYKTYLEHPEHLKLIEKHKPLWQRVVVYDFVRP
ncbi:MAG TPA: Dabb family protein [Planctomycetota bacterium]|mgnify:CR=1 FL=1|nr:Dabb family protein [Planctomycetota bacterium]HRR80326.1 Dabb family protein [Planctomycetota bacterium]HRT94132.1 Dabb family protein [Planctomycetota bacterium]